MKPTILQKRNKSDNIIFDFGENWANYSENSLNTAKIAQAREDFCQFFSGIDLSQKQFLDIGFGQGLSLLIAAEKGAIVTGLDINEKNKTVCLKNNIAYFNLALKPEQLVVGSVLNQSLIENKLASKYDIVHSWGVLHHTGNMWRAIENAAALVAPEGYFLLAIYNRHWSSPVWKIIKKLYNFLPDIFQKLMVYSFAVVIFMAKWAVSLKNPLKKERRMNFYYDVIDWLGGYPYEYASEKEIVDFLQKKGFRLIRMQESAVPTGCYEYVFKR